MKKRSTHQRLHLIERPTSNFIQGRDGLYLHVPDLELEHRIVMGRLDEIAKQEQWAQQIEGWPKGWPA